MTTPTTRKLRTYEGLWKQIKLAFARAKVAKDVSGKVVIRYDGGNDIQARIRKAVVKEKNLDDSPEVKLVRLVIEHSKENKTLTFELVTLNVLSNIV